MKGLFVASAVGIFVASGLAMKTLHFVAKPEFKTYASGWVESFQKNVARPLVGWLENKKGENTTPTAPPPSQDNTTTQQTAAWYRAHTMMMEPPF